MKNRKYLVIAALLAIALMATAIAPSNVQTGGSGQRLSYHSLVRVYVNGKLHDETANIVTNLGKEGIMNRVFFAANQSQVRYIGVGGNTSAMAATDTSLGGDFTGIYNVAYGMNRSMATLGWSGAGTQNITLTYTFTALAACNVNSTGLYNHSTSNTGFFAEAPFTNAALQSSDTLNVTWSVWVA